MTVKSCTNIEFRELAKVQVKGKKESIRIFEPLYAADLTGNNRKILNQFQTARDYFSQQKWQKSRELFQSLLEQSSMPGNTKDNIKNNTTYQLYLDNIEILSQQDLAKNWSGELVFEHK